MIADKAYSSAAIRRTLRRRRDRGHHSRTRRSAGRTGPPRLARRASTGLHPGLYKRRNVVERRIGRLKQWRGIATRFDKLARDYRAAIVLVTALLWINT
ncbi:MULTISPECIES: transposase [Actinomadura]|uniref:transposase n=1 Tax=Actinomadura sp. NPDC000929 TaxID=3154517 RepID=UPI003398F24D